MVLSQAVEVLQYKNFMSGSNCRVDCQAIHQEDGANTNIM